jgi:hypothetical protein
VCTLSTLIRTLAPDPQTAEAALTDIIHTALNMPDEPTPDLQVHLDQWKPHITAQVAAAGGDQQTGTAVGELLDQPAGTDDRDALASILRRILAGGRDPGTRRTIWHERHRFCRGASPGATRRDPIPVSGSLSGVSYENWDLDQASRHTVRRSPRPGESLERSREEVIASLRPLPPADEMLIEDLTETEDRLFMAAVAGAAIHRGGSA